MWFISAGHDDEMRAGEGSSPVRSSGPLIAAEGKRHEGVGCTLVLLPGAVTIRGTSQHPATFTRRADLRWKVLDSATGAGSRDSIGA